MPVAINQKTQEIPYYDVAVLGAGFSGVKVLYEARKRGYSCHVYEGAGDLGGTWRLNRYPGARVDSDIPVYELNIPELYNSWTWGERFPDWSELRAYFDHAEKVLHLKKDIDFNTFIQKAEFNKETGLWYLESKDGKKKCHAKFFLPCIGFASRNYKPDFKNFDKYTGQVVHSNEWPEEDIDMTNRKVAIIGTGSTGVQIAQEAGAVAKELYVLQRTPNLSLPMQQKKSPDQRDKSNYKKILDDRFKSFGGFTFTFVDKDTFDDPPEVRRAFYQSLFDFGGFAFWVGNYRDYLFNQAANDEAYAFWRESVHARVKDPKVAEDLAPKVQPHPFGTKRPSLEQNYFEQFNKENVHLVNIKKNPIKEFYEKGIILEDGSKVEVDLLVLATGFDAVTGSFKNIDMIHSDTKTILRDVWEEGCKTYLGLSLNGYPNLFYTYGPQAPTAFSNGPSCVELQLQFIFKVIDDCFNNNVKYIEATKDAQEKYSDRIHTFTNTTLFPKAKSWYMGANIPGKKVEMLNFCEGIPRYQQLLDSVYKSNLVGFNVVA